MSLTSGKKGEGLGDALCFICAEGSKLWLTGKCSHPICYKCGLRLRILFGLKACSMCKTDLDTVLLTKGRKPYSEEKELCEKKGILKTDPALSIMYTDERDIAVVRKLIRLECPVHSCNEVLPSKEELQEHVKTHNLILCSVCYDHRKLFSQELQLFTKDSLKKHQRIGDKTFKGHPRCEFCNTLFYSLDELYEHCRLSHEKCFLCERVGKRHEYYQNYRQLENHFRTDHFLCPEKSCLEKKFVVFAEEMEYKAHMVTYV